MKVEKADYPWIIDIFYQHFSYGLSRICNADFLQKRYIEFRKKQDPIYLSLLDGMKDDSLSKTFVSYWTIAQTIATQSRFWIEDAITEFLISLAKRRNKNDLRVYSQSMLGDGWMDRGISVVDIGEKELEHLSARRPWRVSMQRKMLEVVDLVVGEQERERVNREGFIKRQWDNTLDQEILEKDRMCLKKVAESLKGPPVAEVALQCNLLVIEPNVPDSKPHAWAFRFINSKTIASHPARKQERVNLIRLYGYLIQEKILRNPLQMNVYVAELVPRKYTGYEGQDRYPDYFSSITYWPSEELWKFIGVPFDVVKDALEKVAVEFREQLISGLRDLLPEANMKNIQKNLFEKS